MSFVCLMCKSAIKSFGSHCLPCSLIKSICRGGSTDEVTYNGCMKAIDQLADYFDGKGIVNQVV